MSDLQSRFEKDDPIEWSGSVAVGWSSNLLAVSQKWLVLFKSSKSMEKPLVWIPRDMVKEIEFPMSKFDLAGQLRIKSTSGETLNFGTLTDSQARQVLPLLSPNYLDAFLRQEKLRGRQVGSLLGKGFLGGELSVFEHKIYSPTKNLDLDENTIAEVVLEGQKVVSARPTLTRMAALSFLPGTALIPGLAFQKKTVNDERQLIIVIANSAGSISMDLDIGQLAQSKGVANQINAIAEQKHRSLLADNSAPVTTTETQAGIGLGQTSTPSVADELLKLKVLLESGLITNDEFMSLKKQQLDRN
jgi:hypothetical protein